MPKLTCAAWLNHWDPASLASFEAHAGALTRVYPVWYAAGPSGQLLRHAEATAAQRRRVLDIARAHGVEVWPLVNNPGRERETWDPMALRLVMGDAGARRGHIAGLLRLAQEDGVQGLDLDYEFLDAPDKQAFSDLVAQVAAAFHGAGLKLGVALHAKDREPGAWHGAQAQDYAALAAVADRVQVMGYDLHGAHSGPGPVAPPDWGARVLAHAAGLIPADKLEWGLPGYGYHWAPGRAAVHLDWAGWGALLKAHPPERRDPASAELNLRFGGEEAWMNDAISLTAKLWPARRAGLRQVALWVLGAEDPRWWALLDTLPEEFVP